ncbi:unnamed protein product [Psylliodes chrysocephalus]|uniref:C-type lectin domain-containing protein n=1 Tax=Psylliodes chrysocephalus TaxID=3402493 RepID=A0A9P0CPE7_9CUCU|nr:unnamed protein product [Psylliodes chrysocephala]
MNSFLALSCFFICFITTFAFVKDDTQLWSHTFKVQEKSFFVNSDKMNFTEALDYCKKNNLQLAAIETLAESEHLYKEMSYLGIFLLPFWSSGTKLSKSNEWIWLGLGELITFFDWNDGEPSTKDGNEFCIAINPDYTGHGFWSSKSCNSSIFSLCQSVSKN